MVMRKREKEGDKKEIEKGRGVEDKDRRERWMRRGRKGKR